MNIPNRGKERIFSCINGEDPDQIPIIAPYSGHFFCAHSHLKTPNLYSSIDKLVENQIALTKMCGFDGIEGIFDFLLLTEACGSKVEMRDYGPLAVTEPIFSSVENFDLLEYPNLTDFDRHNNSMKLLDGIINNAGHDLFVYCTICGPLTLAGELRGLPSLFFDMIVEPGFVDKVVRFSESLIKELVDEILQYEIDGVFIVDPTASGELTNEDQYLRFELRPVSQVISQIKTNHKVSSLHMCGRSTKQFESLISTNVDILNVDTPVKMAALAKKLPGKTVLGNLDPSGSLTHGGKEQILHDCLRCLNEMNGYRYILGTGCGLIPETNFDNLLMLQEARDDFVKYRT